MRIVHLARDEKFIPLMISLFEEALPGQNRFVVARKRRATRRFVADAPQVTFREPWRLRLDMIGADVEGADLVVVHSMTRMFLPTLRSLSSACRIAWIGWGYDYYPLIERRLGLMTLPRTRALAEGVGGDGDEEQPGSARQSWWRRLVPAKALAVASIAERIDVVVVIPCDIDLLRAALPQLRARAHELPLITVEDAFDLGAPSMDGPDILVGNSATSSNNHVEAFELLRRCLPANSRLVVPLSYGNRAYGQRVAALGRDWFGERLDALLDWMPLEAYNRRLGSCGFVLMNHCRQQAAGNIGAALYKGATVYLRPENPLFGFYQRLGAHVRSTAELEAQGATLMPLTLHQCADNRRVMLAYYRRGAVLDAIRALPAAARGT